MSDEETSGKGLAISVKPDGATLDVSDQALTKFGAALRWLMPKRSARVTITSAVAESTARKIKSSEPLSEQELAFVALLFERESKKLVNKEDVSTRVEQVLPSVAEKVRALPPEDDAVATTKDFGARAERIAEEITDDGIRDLFARVIAGELTRPGSCSSRTLELIRGLDPEIARAFQSCLRFLVGDRTLLLIGPVDEPLLRGEALLDLRDAGLLQLEVQLSFAVGEQHPPLMLRYTDRVIRVQASGSGSSSISFPGHRLTRSGREIARVLELAPDEDFFALLKSWPAKAFGKNAQTDWRLLGEEIWHPVAAKQ